MTETEAAYVAGILDGEGHLAYFHPGAGRGRTRPEMQVDSTDPELIAYLQEVAPGMNIQPRPAKGNRKKIYRWRIGGTKACALAEKVAPYMRIDRKRAVAESMLAWPRR